MFPIIDRIETGLNLRRIMECRGISAKDIQEYLGLSCVQSVYRWLDGSNMPTIDNLYALSELFHMSIDEIVCGNRKKLRINDRNEKVPSLNRRMHTYYSMLNGRYIA